MEKLLERISEKAGILSSLFPVQFKFHIILGLLAMLIFGIQFVRLRKKYHLVLAIAFPSTLLPYLMPENVSFFNAIGVFELVALVTALILALTVEKDKKPAKDSVTEQKNEQIPEQQEEKS